MGVKEGGARCVRVCALYMCGDRSTPIIDIDVLADWLEHCSSQEVMSADPAYVTETGADVCSWCVSGACGAWQYGEER